MRSAPAGRGRRGPSRRFRGAPATSSVDHGDPEQVPDHSDGQAWASTHARASLVEPADGDDRDPITAPAGEVDEFDVEYDARDSLAREKVLGCIAPKSLESALGVLHRPDHPYRCDQVEQLAEQPAVAWLR